jgi:tetratricopeptide (TPR) repeat protein
MSVAKFISLMVFASLVVFSASLAAQEAGKNNIEEGKNHFNKGVEFFNNDNFEAALAEFLESFRLNPFWAVRYNVAICYKKTSRFKKSLNEFQAYLDEGGDKVTQERKDEVQKLMDEIRKMLGRLRLCCNLGTITIIVDGTETIQLDEGQEATLDPGLHKIEIRKEGYKPAVRETVVISDNTVEVRIEMESLVSSKPQPPVIEKIKAPEKEKKKYKPELRWLWTGLGVGGALAVGVVVSGVIVLKKKDLMESEVDKGDYIRAYDYQDEARRWKIATNVLIGAAAVTAATGFILAMTGWSPWKKKKAEKKISLRGSLYPEAGLNLAVHY